MKETILEIVQDCLAEMGSDNVNSINDTVESERVAALLKSVYFEIVDFRDWKSHNELIPLNSSNDGTRPNYLRIPDNVQETHWVRYNCIKDGETKSRWETLTYLYPDEFIEKVNQRNNDLDNVDVIIDWSGSFLNIVNDKAPEYWTTFDDMWIVTDSYDSAVDTTLQSIKTQAYVMQEPQFDLVDDFVVDLPVDAFSMLRTALKERAFEHIKQTPSRTITIEAERQRRRMSRKSWQLHGGVRYPNYGRVSGKRISNPTFKQDRD